jgi:hypothetical protein
MGGRLPPPEPACRVGQGGVVAYAVEMFFDERADEAVRGLWRRLASAGLSSLETYGHARHRPHVSLSVMDAVPDVAAIGEVQRLPPLLFPALGMFAGDGGVLFLAPVVTPPLLAVHERVWQSLQGQGHAQWAQYGPGRWVPHCTLAMGLPPAGLAAAAGLLAGFHPVEARVTELGVTDTRTGKVTVLSSWGSP